MFSYSLAWEERHQRNQPAGSLLLALPVLLQRSGRCIIPAFVDPGESSALAGVDRMPRLLSISRNPRLLATRNDALALAGFTVVSPRVPEQALLLLHQEHFDAIVLGHSVEPELRKQLIASIRDASPGLPIAFVFLRAEDPGKEPLADFAVDISHGPMALLQALRNRLKMKRGSCSG